jgi:hypothetical protein
MLFFKQKISKKREFVGNENKHRTLSVGIFRIPKTNEMILKLFLVSLFFAFSFQSISQTDQQEKSSDSTMWHCMEYAHQYQLVVKSRSNPYFPGDLCEKIKKNQHPTQKVVIALGTDVDLVIFPKNVQIDTKIKEVGYEGL